MCERSSSSLIVGSVAVLSSFELSVSEFVAASLLESGSAVLRGDNPMQLRSPSQSVAVRVLPGIEQAGGIMSQAGHRPHLSSQHLLASLLPIIPSSVSSRACWACSSSPCARKVVQRFHRQIWQRISVMTYRPRIWV